MKEGLEASRQVFCWLTISAPDSEQNQEQMKTIQQQQFHELRKVLSGYRRIAIYSYW